VHVHRLNCLQLSWHFISFCEHYQSRSTNISYFENAIFAPLCNSVARQSIVLESCCSNPQMTQQVFESAMKEKFGFGFRVFCEWPHKWCRFLVILPHITLPRVQLLNGRISLKFLLETKLESMSFEPLIDFLAFLVQTLLISYLIMGLINYFSCF